MVCINVRHFIGFNRLWISFLSTSGLFWFYNLWKNMFNSESGTANLVYLVTLAGFICSHRSHPQPESCITYMARYVADPFQSLPGSLWNKGWIPPSTVCFFLCCFFFYPLMECVLSAQCTPWIWKALISHGLWSEQRSWTGWKQGHALPYPNFIQGQSFLSTFHYLSPSFYPKIERNSL